ncbi:3-dehydroquinate synthase [Caldivirga maquilingensis]|uniref:3-dehydroquinate synthase n=1 Tax=Caldivirga maquilingensis (strain ATCC 700844 / DSM 13496 / JCM 10307 / IC-167) TaxID=397948 RepID=A8MCY5_CALMQ|nr:3-dehydroquinate synthase family protein [Caldivirga maquilingensis]ABW01641.1 3-dehydroquinate synthase [Caldivirga maquilingensis IC-167]
MRSFTYRSRCSGEVRVLVNYPHADELSKLLDKYTSCMIITPSSVSSLVNFSKCPRIIIKDGEEGKGIETVLNIIKQSMDNSLDRSGVMIGIGGGSTLDVTGFAAAVYMRGVDYVNVPTTTLAMVDAALGGKTGVNAAGLKNIIGVVKQPSEIIVDLAFIKSLPASNYLDGFAEVLKYGVTMDKGLFDKLSSNVDKVMNRDEGLLEDLIYGSLVNKAHVVEADEYDTLGIRIVLNYGHTIGHALESASGFSISHGKAVGLGMICESTIGVKLGYTNPDIPGYLTESLSELNLIQSIKVNADSALRAITGDKKRNGGFLNLPIVTELGDWVKVRVKVDEYLRLVKESCMYLA